MALLAFTAPVLSQTPASNQPPPAENTWTPASIPARYNRYNQSYLDWVDDEGDSINKYLSGGRKEDNCKGSHYCSYEPWFSDKATRIDTTTAYERFRSDSIYARYTSYTEGHSTAIFDCQPTQFVRGWQVKLEFDYIHDMLGCNICGIHYFTPLGAAENSCYVKLDYCWHCRDRGGPANALEVAQANLTNVIPKNRTVGSSQLSTPKIPTAVEAS
ncbi:MAG: hypothetical protein M1817_000800 [Caeruleum heppii]|nr:MAG: hypothetical protein M1817_000800 [Caeruleum heppii]